MNPQHSYVSISDQIASRPHTRLLIPPHHSRDERVKPIVSDTHCHGSHNSAEHKQLSPLEQDVLWEYARLSDKIKRVSPPLKTPPAERQIANLSKLTADSPTEDLLQLLRTVEKQMGLVLTLVRSAPTHTLTEPVQSLGLGSHHGSTSRVRTATLNSCSKL